jgi:hypothetical protein
MSQEKQGQLQLLKKRFYKYFFRYVAIFILFSIFFLTVRYFIPNEKISPLIILPVFIIALVIEINTIKQLIQIKKEIQKIKGKT